MLSFEPTNKYSKLPRELPTVDEEEFTFKFFYELFRAAQEQSAFYPLAAVKVGKGKYHFYDGLSFLKWHKKTNAEYDPRKNKILKVFYILFPTHNEKKERIPAENAKALFIFDQSKSKPFTNANSHGIPISILDLLIDSGGTQKEKITEIEVQRKIQVATSLQKILPVVNSPSTNLSQLLALTQQNIELLLAAKDKLDKEDDHVVPESAIEA